MRGSVRGVPGDRHSYRDAIKRFQLQKGVTVMIKVEQYKGKQADVNSYLLSDIGNVIVIDLLRNSAEAEKLANHVEASGKK
jgi:hypothetical protein